MGYTLQIKEEEEKESVFLLPMCLMKGWQENRYEWFKSEGHRFGKRRKVFEQQGVTQERRDVKYLYCKCKRVSY